MSWRDREYRDGREAAGGGAMGAAMSLLNGCVPLGRWFGIRVRLHASLIVFIALSLAFGPSVNQGLGVADIATAMGLLFGIVLLHEFGHCLASASVGGRPEEIILSPIGGLAMVPSPHRAGASFIVSAGGPAVNVLICVVCGGALLLMTGGMVPLNPFRPQPPMSFLMDSVPYYLWWTFSISYILLLFNLLPIYPLDGGQLMQAMLWPKLGYARSMEVASATGMAGSVVMGLFGLVVGQLMLVMIAVFGYLYCHQRRTMIREMGAGAMIGSAEYGFGGGAEAELQWGQHEAKHKRLSRRAIRKIQRLAEAERREQQRIDAILEKVSAHGIKSLHWWERRALYRATAKQRQAERDLTRTYREG